jgi:multiple sugar transport system ATP-binding protein
MRIELQKLHRDINATMIYVTHDQVEAMTLGNRIAVLNKGKLMQLDTPIHLYNHPANRFVAGFIGSPAMNFIKGTIVEENEYFFKTEENKCRINLGTEIRNELKKSVNQPLVLGIRPEHISIADENNAEPKSDCKLEITAFENMGNEQLVYFKLQEKPLIVRREPKDDVDFGQFRGLSFLKNKMIFIDGQSGDVLNKDV